MTNKLFVASLAFSVNSQALQDHFAQAGTVVSAQVIIDRATGKSKGFGFVEMSNSDEAQNAMKTLDGSTLEGRQIIVKEARPQEDRSGGNGGGYGGGNRSSHGGGHRDSRGGGRDNRGDRRGGGKRW